MTMPAGLLSLPDESLLTIFRYLHYPDIVRLLSVCKRLHCVCYDDILWKWQCLHRFLDDKCEKNRSWREHFIILFKEFGHYTYYKEIKQAWNKIERFLARSCPSILTSLQEGVSEADLDEAEVIIGHQLPEDIRVSYRIHDGQDVSLNKPGLMGGCMVSTHIRSDSLVQLAVIRDNCVKDDVIGSYSYISVDFATGIRNVLILKDTDELKAGNICHIKNGHDGKFSFILASSFREWLCDYANKLDNDEYYIEHEYIFKFYHEPSCVDSNIGITVKPTTCFIPELSTSCPSAYFFAYRIILEMDSSAPVDLSCRLESRYWHITHGDGQIEEVRGPGVVGEYPVMKPGSKFDWISCVTFDTPAGMMKGSFTFVNLRTGLETDIPCPLFKMSAPLRVCLMKSQENSSSSDDELET